MVGAMSNADSLTDLILRAQEGDEAALRLLFDVCAAVGNSAPWRSRRPRRGHTSGRRW